MLAATAACERRVCPAGDLFAETLQGPTLGEADAPPRQSAFASLMESIGLQTLTMNTLTTTANLTNLTKTATIRWAPVLWQAPNRLQACQPGTCGALKHAQIARMGVAASAYPDLCRLFGDHSARRRQAQEQDDGPDEDDAFKQARCTWGTHMLGVPARLAPLSWGCTARAPAARGHACAAQPDGSTSSCCSRLHPALKPGAAQAAGGRGMTMVNKAPHWNEQLRCWCLNFKGRVKLASVKNFQLVSEDDAQTIVMQVCPRPLTPPVQLR